jgi:hypothetical protein
LRDFDSINRRAEVLERKDRRDVKKTKGENNEDLMMAILCRGMPLRRGGSVDVVPVFPTVDREVDRDCINSPPSGQSHPMYPYFAMLNRMFFDRVSSGRSEMLLLDGKAPLLGKVSKSWQWLIVVTKGDGETIV